MGGKEDSSFWGRHEKAIGTAIVILVVTAIAYEYYENSNHGGNSRYVEPNHRDDEYYPYPMPPDPPPY